MSISLCLGVVADHLSPPSPMPNSVMVAHNSTPTMVVLAYNSNAKSSPNFNIIVINEIILQQNKTTHKN